MYSDKFMEVSTSVNNDFIFGLGERRQRFRFKSGSYSFWNKDAPTHNENGKPDGQLYGHHPMYLKREINGKFHIGFLRNAGGMLVEYAAKERLTFRMISGIVEFKFFLGDNKPENVVKKYHRYINGFALHPFWSQGFHQCRWGYKNSGELLDVWNSYNSNNLPFDVLWSDIDYMQNLWDFTIDTSRFKVADMQKFTNL
jgi:alpha-glucosidase